MSSIASHSDKNVSSVNRSFSKQHFSFCHANEFLRAPGLSSHPLCWLSFAHSSSKSLDALRCSLIIHQAKISTRGLRNEALWVIVGIVDYCPTKLSGKWGNAIVLNQTFGTTATICCSKNFYMLDKRTVCVLSNATHGVWVPNHCESMFFVCPG